MHRIIALSLLAICFYVLSSWVFFVYYPVVSEQQGLKYKVNNGASIHSIAADLNTRQVIYHPYFFKILARLMGNTNELKAGIYYFPKGSSPYSMLQQMLTGTGIAYRIFTIIPGTTFSQVLENLNKADGFTHTLQSANNTNIMQQLGHPELQPEGEFYPDTYYFDDGATDLSVLKRAFNAMQTKLYAAWQKRDILIPFHTPYEALIAASIIEKEAYVTDELPMIAGVMVNRLRKGMLLQFDPTVIYGLQGRFDGTLHKINLADNNPYNTYIHKGLPPTPISMPGQDALDAVMHPLQHDYYYFVARKDGHHQFSKTLNEHNAAVSRIKTSQPWFFNYSLFINRIQKVSSVVQ